MAGETYSLDWQNGPQNTCTRLINGAGAIRAVNPADGQLR